MLDSVTKKRINNLRDILVGKTPSPMSQVEQITIGLIYKFMHDMDVEAVKMGGAPSFFVGAYEKYSWNRLFDPKLSGADKVQLYSEAIEGMYTNPTAPPLFREIFKDASLPFKTPATLNMFLKEINQFEYSHSEKLGDAFEYLLSFMGSQGDAAQFRTPRHIIDFMVAIVNPQKHETILDPACGTAGFLISSFKHILSQNTNKTLGDKLTASERKKIGGNLVGYDLSPDMTRISLANMYLHQFANPQIYEYDTLSSEDKWNEYYRVILANPPFFSPKGGIQPHSRFGVQSKRAEVLFVDYIMQHLHANGRAGIIVPEGIVFHTGTAYKTLRKKLVEDCLVGVISLPAGVFQPYSGVKTSILILDKALHQKLDSIFFARVENDGFSLGAQRTPIAKNDLPEILTQIRSFIEGGACNLQLEKQSQILSNKDVSLNGASYKRNEVVNSSYEMASLGNKDLFEVLSGGTPKSNEEAYWGGELSWITLVDLPASNLVTQIQKSEKTITELGLKNSSAKMIPVNSVVVSTRATIGRVGINRIPLSTNQGFKNIVIKDKNRISCEFLAYMMTNLTNQMIGLASGATFKEVTKTNFERLSVPLPPIAIQQQIVDELEGYQRVIDGCRQIVDNYKPTLAIDPSWEMVALGNVVSINPKKSEVQALDKTMAVSYVPMEDLHVNEIRCVASKEKPLGEVYNEYTYFRDGDVLLAKLGSCFENGKAGIAQGLTSGIGFGSSEFYVLRCGNRVLPEWVYINIVTKEFRRQGAENFTGTTLRRVPKTFVEQYQIPIPSMDIQKELVTKIKQEISTIEGNKRLIETYTQKIQDRISKVWGG